jgi:hypothetical protein
MGGKFDPEHFGIERNVVAYTSAPALRANSIAYGGNGELDKTVAFLQLDEDNLFVPSAILTMSSYRTSAPRDGMHICGQRVLPAAEKQRGGQPRMGPPPTADQK